MTVAKSMEENSETPGDQAQTFIKIKIDLAQMAAPALANLENRAANKIKMIQVGQILPVGTAAFILNKF